MRNRGVSMAGVRGATSMGPFPPNSREADAMTIPAGRKGTARYLMAK